MRNGRAVSIPHSEFRIPHYLLPRRLPPMDDSRSGSSLPRPSHPSRDFPIVRRSAEYLGALWKTPSAVMMHAGAAGEVTVARTRLILAALVLLIPIVDWLLPPRETESLIGIAAAQGCIQRAGIQNRRVSHDRGLPDVADWLPGRGVRFAPYRKLSS